MKLSDYKLIQKKGLIISRQGDQGYRIAEFYEVPAPVIDAADAVIEAAKLVADRLRIEKVPLELLNEVGDPVCDAGEFLEDAIDALDAAGEMDANA